MRRFLVCALVIFLFAPSVFAQWIVNQSVDEMTDEVRVSAAIRNAEDFVFMIMRLDNVIFGAIEVPAPHVPERFDDLRLRARVDKNDAWEPLGDPNLTQRGASPGGVSGLDMLWFPLWEGEGEYSIFDGTSHMNEILNGQSILFRVNVVRGTVDARFPLGPSAREAILEAIKPDAEDVNPDASPSPASPGAVINGAIRVDPLAHYLESTGPRIHVDTNPLHLVMDLSRLKTLEVFPTPKNNYEEQLWMERTGGVKPVWRTRATGRYALGGNLVIDSVEVIKVYPRRRKRGKAFIDIDMRARLVRVSDLVGVWMWYSAEILADGVPIAHTTWPPKLTSSAPAVRLEYRWETTEEQLETWMQAGTLELRVKAWPQE